MNRERENHRGIGRQREHMFHTWWGEYHKVRKGACKEERNGMSNELSVCHVQKGKKRQSLIDGKEKQKR